MRRIALAAVPLVALAAVVALSARGGQERSQLRIVRVASGLTEPVAVTAPRNEPNNVYVVEKVGRIRVIVGGRLRARPFLDIRSLVLDNGEQGFLGLAFSPKYATDRHFYVDYTDRNGDARLVEYKSRGLSRTPRRLRQIFFQNDPYPNHNGGNLVFGPDGYLYTGTGDGGSGGDPQNRAQNLKSTFGKLLKFNVTRKRPQPLIVGYGLRNPWRFSFDRQTGDLYIGDVGQDAWEEIDSVSPVRSTGFLNFGWGRFEGTHLYNSGRTLRGGTLTFPVAQYSHSLGNVIIGGYVYRGSIASLRGTYFYADNGAGWIRGRTASGAVRPVWNNVGNVASNYIDTSKTSLSQYRSFARDPYCLNYRT